MHTRSSAFVILPYRCCVRSWPPSRQTEMRKHRSPWLLPALRFPSRSTSRGATNITSCIPAIQIRYLPEGTGNSGIKILSGVGDLGGGDAPILDKQLKDAPVQILQLPSVLIGIAIVYNIPDTPGELRPERAGAGGHFSGQSENVERSGDRKTQSGNETAGRADPGDPSHRRQRIELHSGGLSVQSEPGISGQGRTRRIAEMAGGRKRRPRAGPGRKGARHAGSDRLHRTATRAESRACAWHASRTQRANL